MVLRILLLLLPACALYGCDEFTKPRDEATSVPLRSCLPPYSDSRLTAPTVFCADPATMQSASVVRIVDGDTLRVLIDGVEEPVRFYGIDTPERGEPCFAEATSRAEALAGDAVGLVRDARNRDRNGRLLRYVYTPSGLSLDATLIAEGLALAWTADGRLRDSLITLETDARASGTGCLWSGT